MFKVKDKAAEQIYTVYNIQECRGTTYFLIYKKPSWYWVTANDYEPYEEPTKINEPNYIPIPYIPYAPTINPNDNWWNKPYITWTAQNNSNSTVTTE